MIKRKKRGRELALKELEKARKHFEKIFDILNREEEIFELETYYGTIGCYFDDLKHENWKYAIVWTKQKE